jgi:hypothetical protein
LMIPKTPRFWPEMNTRRGVVVLWPRLAFVDIGALDRAAGELLGGFDDPAERVPVIRVSRQRPGMKHKLPARPARALVGGTSPLIGGTRDFCAACHFRYARTGSKTEVAALERHVRCTLTSGLMHRSKITFPIRSPRRRGQASMAGL